MHNAMHMRHKTYFLLKIYTKRTVMGTHSTKGFTGEKINNNVAQIMCMDK